MKNKIIKKLKVNHEQDLWRVYAQFGTFAIKLNRLPDAGELQRNQPRSAPAEISGMVF